MARVTADEVLEIMGGTGLVSGDLTAFITAASLIVTTHLTGQHEDDVLKEIERWLAAHLASSSPKSMVAKSVKIGDAAMSTLGKFDMGLNSTQYGQTVLLMDTSGKLANLGKKRVSFEVIEQSLV